MERSISQVIAENVAPSGTIDDQYYPSRTCDDDISLQIVLGYMELNSTPEGKGHTIRVDYFDLQEMQSLLRKSGFEGHTRRIKPERLRDALRQFQAEHASRLRIPKIIFSKKEDVSLEKYKIPA